jgi:hypothetical protein
MKILMLGNSFTFAHNMPELLAEITGAEVVAYTRGGARLAEFLNPNTKMGTLTRTAFDSEKWDYVVLQEMSNGAITANKSFMNSVEKLCEICCKNGAVPVLYATWAYKKDGRQLAKFGMDYDEMYRQMYENYHKAADTYRTLIADVGKRFYEIADTENIYADDGCHPNERGARIAVEVIAEVVLADGK